MSHAAAQTLSATAARSTLGLAPDEFVALARSGLLGKVLNGQFRLRAIEEFIRYGTQWSGQFPSPLLQLEVVEKLGSPAGTFAEGEPPDAGIQLQVASHPDPRAEEDTSWLAQFYLRPNPHLYPAPTALTLIGPILLRLTKARDVPGAACPTRLFPGPDGYLAMLQVKGAGSPTDVGFRTAYDVAFPVLDELALTYDVPLHVCQIVVIGVPSGVLTLFFGKHPKMAILDEARIPSGCNHGELREAIALYRDAISSDNVFHRFLSLYKTYESCCAVRGKWRKRTRRAPLKLTDEVIPKRYAFQGYEGLTFDQAKQRINKAFRIALAHGNVPGGTPANGRDYLAVAGDLAVIRYIARVTLLNVRATLRA